MCYPLHHSVPRMRSRQPRPLWVPMNAKQGILTDCSMVAYIYRQNIRDGGYAMQSETGNDVLFRPTTIYQVIIKQNTIKFEQKKVHLFNLCRCAK